jgi:hypothetical protein
MYGLNVLWQCSHHEQYGKVVPKRVAEVGASPDKWRTSRQVDATDCQFCVQDSTMQKDWVRGTLWVYTCTTILYLRQHMKAKRHSLDRSTRCPWWSEHPLLYTWSPHLSTSDS